MKNPLSTAQAFPEAFLQRMSGLLGDEYNEFLASLHNPATTGLRVNTLKLSPQEYSDLSPYNLSLVPWCSCGYIVQPQTEIDTVTAGKHPYHSAGLYYLQEPSAMAAAEILAPRPGDKVLDLSAAPGGKATHLAALMKNTGLLVANEIHTKRVWDLVENLERCGVTNALVTNESPRKLADFLGEYFDRVMLDAPCSGEGMFRKSQLARKEWKPELASSCAVRQSNILEHASRMVKPGGYLAYTTCTFSTEENEGVIANFLSQHPEFEHASFQPSPGYQPAKPEWIGLNKGHMINRAIRIWPHLSHGEGHFIALMVKLQSHENLRVGEAKKTMSYSHRLLISKSKDLAMSILDNFCRDHLFSAFETSQIILDGSYIYRVPEFAPPLHGLNVIHPGWWLGTIHKDRFVPSHSFAMGMTGDQAKQILSLQVRDRRVSSYFSGESFPDSGENGWVLVTVEGFPIGWGKRVQNVLKNFYPHGLRHIA